MLLNRVLALVGLVVLTSYSVRAQSSEAYVTQVGTSHVALVDQTASYLVLNQTGGVENLVMLDQMGGSRATVFQTGSGNRLFGLGGEGSAALQLDGSSLLLTQIGSNNTAMIEQAMGGFAVVTQIGSNNTATIWQQ